MKKIKKLIIMGLIVAFAAFLVFPSFLFASGYPDSSSITSITPGECGEETTVCIDVDFGEGSFPLGLRITVVIAGDGVLAGFPVSTIVQENGEVCINIGVVPPGDYVLGVDSFPGNPGGRVLPHRTGTDRQPFTVEECPNGTITVLKVDSEGTKMEGAGFTLLEPDESLAHSEKLTDANGQLSFGMPYGSYIVRETTVPSGFTGAADQAVTINKDNPSVSLKFVNTAKTTTTDLPPEN